MNIDLLEKILPPKTVTDVLNYVLLSLLFTVFALFFILIYHKLSIEFTERRRRRLRARYSSYLRKFLLGRDGTVVRPRSKLGYEVLSALCIEKLQTSSEFDHDAIKHYIRGSFIAEYYRKMAESSSMPKRFHAIKRLGYFSLEELKQYFKDSLMEEKTDEVKGAIVWAMSRIANESTLDWITLVLSTEISFSSKYNEYVYSNLIRSFQRKGIVVSFLAFLERLIADQSFPIILKRDIIEACGSCRLHEASRIIVDLFFSADGHPAIKIACMRALGRLECPDYEGVVTSALFHDDWRVRSQAAQAASACSESAIPHLRNLLYDDYYYVRINAARSLSQMGDEGVTLLTSEMNSDDPFVRDTARFMLRR
jgi:hypothetical protein